MIVLRVRAGEITVNGEKHADEMVELGSGLLIEGEKSCEIENQNADAITMTVGDLAAGGTQIEIPAGATFTVSGPLPVKLEGAHVG